MKNNFLLCFRPDSSNFVGDPSFSTKPRTSNGDSKITKAKPVVVEKEGSKGSGKETQVQKKNLIRSFSGTLRPAFFEISLKKKSRKKKLSQLSIGCQNTAKCKNDVFSDSTTGSQSSTTESSASSPTSTISSNPSPTSQKLTGKNRGITTLVVTLNQKKQTANKVNSHSSSSVGLFCVLITMSLAIIMFYGRVCAVTFTTLCLLLFSLRRNDEVALPERRKKTSTNMEVSARDYRKRVIMEGMLERNNLKRTY